MHLTLAFLGDATSGRQPRSSRHGPGIGSGAFELVFGASDLSAARRPARAVARGDRRARTPSSRCTPRSRAGSRPPGPAWTAPVPAAPDAGALARTPSGSFRLRPTGGSPRVARIEVAGVALYHSRYPRRGRPMSGWRILRLRMSLAASQCHAVIAIIVAYAIGSMPFALLLARRWGMRDLRRHRQRQPRRGERVPRVRRHGRCAGGGARHREGRRQRRRRRAAQWRRCSAGRRRRGRDRRPHLSGVARLSRRQGRRDGLRRVLRS